MDFKMKYLWLVWMLTSCAAVHQDLSGKMFTFPQRTTNSHVRLTAVAQDLGAITVCHRSYTDLKTDHVLFSLAVPSNANAFLVYWEAANKEMEISVRDRTAEIHVPDYKPNQWNSICTTWDSETGLVQQWLDGNPTVRKFTSSGARITGQYIIMMGQEQDSHGGGFDPKQVFTGMITDVHMWDHTLSACEIQNYMDNLYYSPGNVLNWRAMEYQIVDQVLVEEEQRNCR